MSYNPSLHTTSNKSYGVSGIPIDARSYYFDMSTFSYRVYNNTTEVFNYLVTPQDRKGHFSIFCKDGFQVVQEYWFKNGIENIDLVLKTGSGVGIDLFRQLQDVPSTYVGQANKIVSVKSDQTGLNFTGLETLVSNGLRFSNNNIKLGGELIDETTTIGNASNRIQIFSNSYSKSHDIKNSQGLNSTNIFTNLDVSSGSVQAGLSASDSNGSNSFVITPNTTTFIDNNINKWGIIYDRDLSETFVDRSLVDKKYVDTQISNIEISASNGLTKTGNDISLGGNTNWQYIDNILIGDYSNGTIQLLPSQAILSGPLGNSGVFLYNGTASLQTRNPDNTSQLSGLNFNNSQMLVTDDRFTKGLEYADDYSANFTDRSLIDKGYVGTGKTIGANTTGNALTATDTNRFSGYEMNSGEYDLLPDSIIGADDGETGMARYSPLALRKFTGLEDAIVNVKGLVAKENQVVNSGFSIVSPYDTIPVSSNNFTAGTSSIEVLNKSQKYRIRQNGTIHKVSLYIESITNLNEFYVTVWRFNGTDFTKIGESNNLVGFFVAGQLNTLNLNKVIQNVKVGDYYGYRTVQSGTWSGMTANSGISNSIAYYVANQSSLSSPYNWTGGSATPIAGYAVPIGLYMAPPFIVYIGDSNVQGIPYNSAFTQTDTQAFQLSTYWGDLLATKMGWTYQNMGHGSDRTDEILARFANDVVALKPKMVVINAGINSILQGYLEASIKQDLKDIIDIALNNAIVPIFVPIIPCNGASNSQMQMRDRINIEISEYVSSKKAVVVTGIQNALGQFRVGGDTNNLWDFKNGYNSDAYHLEPIGSQAYVEAIQYSLQGLIVNSKSYLSELAILSPPIASYDAIRKIDISSGKTIEASTSGNAATVTNGVYTTTFNTLGDSRYTRPTDVIQNQNSVSQTANFKITGSGEASSFIKTGGISSQFLKADGSIDSSTYLTTASITASNGIVKSGNDFKLGGTLNGSTTININGNDIKIANSTGGGLIFANTVASRLGIQDSSGIATKHITINTTNIAITDDTGLKGAVYGADYSTNGKLDDRWLPDWGAIKGTFIAKVSPVTITTTSQQAVVNTKYIANNASLVTITLPTDVNSSIGDQVLIRGLGIGLWKLAQNASQVIHGVSDTTPGIGGYIQAQSRYDNLTVEKITVNEWTVISSQGTLTIV